MFASVSSSGTLHLFSFDQSKSKGYPGLSWIGVANYGHVCSVKFEESEEGAEHTVCMFVKNDIIMTVSI